ncbi:hypothetical protein K458DRAFT_488733 [Lentithecium fluviatile CBS 122367]|uniref:Uncharacterized protein n=1 Tax=Lentithecium fluviatile CBS 122367 TaxID=1168545 RepID=A0A6G1IW83_9PLEO|nr:hypothetical protein K458DRAFT_488733 [Lentithecium fluviatile CBS 122367]
MRASGLSALLALLALLSLNVAASSLPTCHADQPLPTDNAAKAEIVKSVQDGIGSFCSFPGGKEIIPENGDTFSFALRTPVNFEINRIIVNVQPTQAQCIEVFIAILEQCVMGKGVFGEYTSSDGLSYQIYHDEEVAAGKRGLDARAKAKKTKPVKTTKKTTATSKPTATNKPKPSSAKATPKPTPPAKGKPAELCKNIAKKAAVGNKPGKKVPKQPTKGNHSLLRRVLQSKTSAGDNRPCGANGFTSNMFRDFQDHLSHHPQTDAFGFVDPVNCNNYNWVSRAQSAQFTQSRTAGAGYATEHLLEWQIIAGFFNYLRDHVYNNRQFVHPDPQRNNAQCNFQTYFEKNWAWPSGLNARRFSLPGSAAATPFEHIANAYPSDTYRSDELVLLQGELNGIKSRIFSNTQAYDRAETQGWVATDPRAALWRVRQAIGVQRYLQATRAIFANQVREIRAAIVAVDNVLPAHPRQVGNRAFHPWAPLGLGPLFDTYMDIIWRGAQHELSSFIADIHDRIRPHCTQQRKQQYQQQGNQNMIVLCNDWATARTQRQIYGTVPRPW